MVQFARPSADVSVGVWTSAPLYQKIDEAIRSDADLIDSADNQTGPCEIALSTVSDPFSSTGHTLRYTVRKNATGGHNLGTIVTLLQGATTIAQWTHTGLTNVWQLHEQTLSAAQADAITDYSDLRISFTRDGDTGGPQGNRRTVQVSWVELETPDAGTPPPPTITTTTLPNVTEGVAYSQTLDANDGDPPFTWSVVSGSLPAGLTLNGSTGEISGTPTAVGTASFTVQVEDSSAQTDTQALSITVDAAPEPGSGPPVITGGDESTTGGTITIDPATDTDYANMVDGDRIALYIRSTADGQTWAVPSGWTVRETGPNGRASIIVSDGGINKADGPFSFVPSVTGNNRFHTISWTPNGGGEPFLGAWSSVYGTIPSVDVPENDSIVLAFCSTQGSATSWVKPAELSVDKGIMQSGFSNVAATAYSEGVAAGPTGDLSYSFSTGPASPDTNVLFVIPGPSAPSGVTGTGAVRTQPVSVNAAGRTINSGVGNVTGPSAVIGGTGSQVITGAGAIALKPVEVEADSRIAITGTGQVAVPLPQVNATGTPVQSSTGQVTLEPVEVTSTGKLVNSGSGQVVVPSSDVSASGTLVNSGQAELTGAQSVIEAEGTLVGLGTGAVTTEPVSIEATGSTTITGSGQVALQPVEVEATSELLVVAQGDISLQPSTVEGSGSSVITGSGAVHMQPVEVEASSGLVVGQAEVNAQSVEVDAVGSEVVTGSGAVAFSGPIVHGTTEDVVFGQSNFIAQPPTVSAEGTTVNGGTAEVTGSTPQVQATGSQAVTGSGSITASAVVVNGTGEPVTEAITGTGQVTTQSASVEGNGVLVVSGSGSVEAGTSDVSSTGTPVVGGVSEVTASTVKVQASGLVVVSVTGVGVVAIPSALVESVGAPVITSTSTVLLTAVVIVSTGRVVSNVTVIDVDTKVYSDYAEVTVRTKGPGYNDAKAHGGSIDTSTTAHSDMDTEVGGTDNTWNQT